MQNTHCLHLSTQHKWLSQSRSQHLFFSTLLEKGRLAQKRWVLPPEGPWKPEACSCFRDCISAVLNDLFTTILSFFCGRLASAATFHLGTNKNTTGLFSQESDGLDIINQQPEHWSCDLLCGFSRDGNKGCSQGTWDATLLPPTTAQNLPWKPSGAILTRSLKDSCQFPACQGKLHCTS